MSPRSGRHYLSITSYIFTHLAARKPSGLHVVGGMLPWILCLFLFTAPAITFDTTWHLLPQDILVDSHATPTSRLEIKIKASKTDPTRKGVSLLVGCTHTCLCPVTAILAYLRTSLGLLFMLNDGTALTC